MKYILNWFQTAPKVKSKDVLMLEKMNKQRLILEAVDDERRNYLAGNGASGKSLCGSVTVIRVGNSYSIHNSIG